MISRNPRHSSIKCVEEARNVNQLQTSPMTRPRVVHLQRSQAADMNSQSKTKDPENRRVVSWSCDMEGHSEKCVERHCELGALWFRLLSRWRRKAVQKLTKPRNTQARRQSLCRWAKDFSRWLQCDMKRAHQGPQLKKRRRLMSRAR